MLRKRLRSSLIQTSLNVRISIFFQLDRLVIMAQTKKGLMDQLNISNCTKRNLSFATMLTIISFLSVKRNKIPLTGSGQALHRPRFSSLTNQFGTSGSIFDL